MHDENNPPRHHGGKLLTNIGSLLTSSHGNKNHEWNSEEGSGIDEFGFDGPGPWGTYLKTIRNKYSLLKIRTVFRKRSWSISKKTLLALKL